MKHIPLVKVKCLIKNTTKTTHIFLENNISLQNLRYTKNIKSINNLHKCYKFIACKKIFKREKRTIPYLKDRYQ